VIHIPASEVGPGTVHPVEVDGDDFVVWRGTSGVLGIAPRRCPHLDEDLAEGFVAGDELVCRGHGWSFDCAGHAFKRNEFGRIDPKDDVETLQIAETDGVIEVGR
jgi:phenylpropionate dioxygenase-like ring-hydroxylating dioxygenase large terminal subunit